MVGILVMLNNYFHDFATALLVVSTFVMMSLVRYADNGGDEVFRKRLPAIYPVLLHITSGTLVLLLMAGIVRTFSYRWFEWIRILDQQQIPLWIIKHIVMFAITGYGVYLWVGIHKKIKRMRSGA